MKKILVPTDFSKPAEIATHVAAQIAKKAEARVILLHIVEYPNSTLFNIAGEITPDEDWDDQLSLVNLVARTKKMLERRAEEVRQMGVPVATELKRGGASFGIRKIITEYKVDLVVMGTSGKSKFEEMIIGSNTEKVIRFARCPVLTVHETPKSTDFKNIVYATSLDEREKDFAKVVKTTQEMYDSTIHVVRINTPDYFLPDHIAEKALQQFVKKLRLENYTLNTFSDRTEEEGIIHLADAIDADLITMATHGRKGFAHVLAGSIAEEVANHARRPVLTYVINK